MMNQQRNIIATLVQRWHPQRHNIQAIKEILAEALSRDLHLKIATGRCYDTHLDLDVAATADTLKRLLL